MVKALLKASRNEIYYFTSSLLNRAALQVIAESETAKPELIYFLEQNKRREQVVRPLSNNRAVCDQ